MKILVSAYIRNVDRIPNTAADHLGFTSVHVLELTGFHQGIFMYCTHTCRKGANLQLCNTAKLWIRKYNGFLLQLTRCWVITVGNIIKYVLFVLLGLSDRIYAVLYLVISGYMINKYAVSLFWIYDPDWVYHIDYIDT